MDDKIYQFWCSKGFFLLGDREFGDAAFDFRVQAEFFVPFWELGAEQGEVVLGQWVENGPGFVEGGGGYCGSD